MRYDYYLSSLLGSLGTGIIFCIIAVIVILIIADWKIFQKAGRPGWASIIPIYSTYVEYAIFWGCGWLFLLPIALTILGNIPYVGVLFVIAHIIVEILHQYKTAEAFGQGIGFTIGLILLHPIFICILAFGSSYTYHGVPIDGVSYKEMKTKFDKVDAKSKDVKFDAPPVEKEREVKFEQPEVKATSTPNVGPLAKEKSGVINVEPLKEKKPEDDE